MGNVNVESKKDIEEIMEELEESINGQLRPFPEEGEVMVNQWGKCKYWMDRLIALIENKIFYDPEEIGGMFDYLMKKLNEIGSNEEPLKGFNLLFALNAVYGNLGDLEKIKRILNMRLEEKKITEEVYNKAIAYIEFWEKLTRIAIQKALEQSNSAILEIKARREIEIEKQSLIETIKRLFKAPFSSAKRFIKHLKEQPVFKLILSEKISFGDIDISKKVPDTIGFSRRNYNILMENIKMPIKLRKH